MNDLSGMQSIVDLFKLEQQIQRGITQRQYNLVLSLYDRIIEIKQTIPNKLGLAKTIADKAHVYEQLGYMSEALKFYQSAYQIAHGSPNDAFLKTLSNRIYDLQRSA